MFLVDYHLCKNGGPEYKHMSAPVCVVDLENTAEIGSRVARGGDTRRGERTSMGNFYNFFKQDHVLHVRNECRSKSIVSCPQCCLLKPV